MEDEDIVVVCGNWKVEKKRWIFDVDNERGSRIVAANGATSFEDFLSMVFEDFCLDSRIYDAKLSYMLAKKKRSDDTPPVFVGNGRQFEAYLRKCKEKSVRLCMELEKRRHSEGRKRRVEEDVNVGERKTKKVKDEGIRSEDEEEDGREADLSEDEEDLYRFDYCEDIDGASSGDEDYRLHSTFTDDEEEDVDESEETVDVKENLVSPEKKFSKANSAKEVLKLEMSRLEMSGVDLAVGQRYENNDALEIRLKILSVLQKFDFNVDRSRPGLYTVNCWVPGCLWRVRASSVDDSPSVCIRIYVRNHTCSVTERSARARQATPEILGHLYKCFVGGVGPGVLPCHVAEALNMRYGIKVDYWKARRTLIHARELVRGTAENGYEELPCYLYMVRRANPGTLTTLKVDDQNRFKYVFISFGASIHGFQFMRKVVVVDGTFLKGKYKGTLLLATTQDGNFNIFPLAFAVVDIEDDQSWEWFFRELSRVIPDDDDLAIISDRHKSIGNAIANVYPLASRGVCTYHLHKNIIVRFRGSETFGLVKKAASTYRLAEFNALFQQIYGLNPQLHSYLERSDVRLWSRVHFPGDRYNFTTSNIAESINKVLNPARSYPIKKLLDAVRFMLTRWFAKRRNEAGLMITSLTKGVERLLKVRVEKAKLHAIQQIDHHQYEVTNGSATNVVNLTENKCSCRKFDLEKLPCMHAIAAAESANLSRIGLCHPYYWTAYLRNGYAKSILPKDDSTLVPEKVAMKICKPPVIRKAAGRPKLSRFKGPLEIAMERRKPRKLHMCSKCQKAGHNRTTCGK